MDIPPKLKATRRKAEIIEVHGGRIIRSGGRKDRHSKVCTARGTRDRRVRLSPRTAIQFYDVQDRLGYDRPSKAIDWLMKEAKAAIDALNEPPPLDATNVTENQQMQQESGRGITQNLENLNNDNPSSSFGFLSNGPDFQAYPSDDFSLSISRREAPDDSVPYPNYNHEDFFSAPLTTTSEIFDLEMARLQRIFTWNYANARGAGEDYSSVHSLPLNFPAGSPVLGLGQMFSQREPLQSRITSFSPITSQFPGISFSSDELPNFTTAASLKENEMEKVAASTAFLHYEK
ncbi:hypothetical protein CDL12_01660 [Handroanthus impetiginosus]|uniref:TCP domain-containing protein n=1 Tax=Handroanthus impetiginosus TaxID=429701 RepID=A0A2G9I759_9LAMI|nr:hypothetical protein CDL12_01660 [Handroanthus impetiginosus]